MKRSIDLEASQVKRLADTTDEIFKLEVTINAMSLLQSFSKNQCSFKKYDLLKLNEKNRLLMKTVEGLTVQRDLYDVNIESGSRIEFVNYFVFNLVALFFQAHMIANMSIKLSSIDLVINFFRNQTKIDVKYENYCS